MDAGAGQVEAWAELELAAWRGFALAGDALREALRFEAEASQSVFLFHFEGERVHFDDKSIGYADPPQHSYRDALLARGHQYCEFLEATLRASGSRMGGVIAFELEDLGGQRFAVPVFAFQKQRGANTILLPDVDFLSFDFYEAAEHADHLPFAAKRPTAVFVGSTTGDPLLTAELVRTLGNRRLRSAMFFKHHADVLFDLPNIVQYDSSETYAMIRELDVGGGVRSWAEQLESRYLLSMDGNGATCSRVALALRSNAVLLKYNSPYLLYYFHGLQPWMHYVPIMRDEDILDLLAEASRHEALHLDIARQSRLFAERLLCRGAVLRYAGAVLDGYLRRFFDQSGG